MLGTDLTGRRARAREITATLAGRRIGLCGFDAGEAHRISGILSGAEAIPVVFDERLLAGSVRVCDVLMIKLLRLGEEGVRASAFSPAPVLAIAPSQALLEGAAGAYRWPRDCMSEPWSPAELLVRLYRLLACSHAAPQPAGRPSRNEPRVLVADDDPELVAFVDIVLRRKGIDCLAADNGLTALRMARDFEPDLLLLDVRMPVMNGFEVLRAIRCDPTLQKLPVVLLTACDDSADIAHGSELNADEYLGKPVSPTLLWNRVSRLLSDRIHEPPEAHPLPAPAMPDNDHSPPWTVSRRSGEGREKES
jgi:CheY-like chemotaxis protein